MSAAANDSERGAKVFLTTLSILLAPVFLGLLVLCLLSDGFAWYAGILVLPFIALLLAPVAAVIAVLFCVFSQGAGRSQSALPALTLSDVDEMDGLAFERCAATLLRSEGFTDVQVTKGSGDFGVDVLASKGSLRYAIQVKRYEGVVSRQAVSDAVAGKDHFSCNAAMVITNSYLSKRSRGFARSVGCAVVDRDVLSDWLARL